jgi:thiol-disulfide isomerase/thioredoxin
MNQYYTYEALRESGVLEERDGSVALTSGFRSTVNEKIVGESDSNLAEPSVNEARALVPAFDEALGEYVENSRVTVEEVLPVVLSVNFPPLNRRGTPDGFLPIQGGFAPPLVDRASAAIVYVWQNDCEPCDQMAPLLSELSTDYQSGLPISAHGPSNADLLYEQFDINGAPTTLFVDDGAVTARILGAKNESVVRSEVEKIIGKE